MCRHVADMTFDISGVNLPLPADMTRPTFAAKRKETLSWNTFVWKNWCQRINIDKVMDQRIFDILHGNANMDSMKFFLYPLGFIGCELYLKLHFYTTTNMNGPILTKLWLGKLWLWNPSSQHQFLPSHNYNNIQSLVVIFTYKCR